MKTTKQPRAAIYTQNGYHVDMSFYRVANWITIDNAKQNNNRREKKHTHTIKWINPSSLVRVHFELWTFFYASVFLNTQHYY